jgi:hypothetical protein
MTDTERLKALTRQCGILVTEMQTLVAEQQARAQRLAAVQAQIAQVRAEQRALQAKGTPTISEHAYVRFLERVLGYDLAVLQAGILTEEVCQRIHLLGDGEYPVRVGGHAFTMVVHKNVVTTLKTKGGAAA